MQGCTGGVGHVSSGNTAAEAAPAWCWQEASKSAAAERLLLPEVTGAVRDICTPSGSSERPSSSLQQAGAWCCSLELPPPCSAGPPRQGGQVSPALPVDAPGPLLLYSVKVIAASQETDVVDLHDEAALQ